MRFTISKQVKKKDIQGFQIPRRNFSRNSTDCDQERASGTVRKRAFATIAQPVIGYSRLHRMSTIEMTNAMMIAYEVTETCANSSQKVGKLIVALASASALALLLAVIVRL